jgi:hypothetical protein
MSRHLEAETDTKISSDSDQSSDQQIVVGLIGFGLKQTCIFFG